ncbi:MAG: CTP synthase (glutamine hydrolyzing) [Methanosarcinaceae archaeon]|nr:CTP synthase (glutamine hydrolyzing) [Methanosarcinaceae archaeon]
MKYIVVTGGVISGLGKGITTASIGRNLKNRGYAVTAIKIDPYLNVDAGLISPLQHGEIFVLKDGGEVDLDLGNYERFLDTELKAGHDITTGKVYQSVINKERRGEYRGKTVQIIPHITNEIKYLIRRAAQESEADVCLIEVGGTVGDIESMFFLEALRLMKQEEKKNMKFIHVSLAFNDTQGEQKTKPTQHSIKEMRTVGLSPDFIVVRTDTPLQKNTKEKISLFCDVSQEYVISAHTVSNLYDLPQVLEEQKLTDYLIKELNLPSKGNKIDQEWNKVTKKMKEISERDDSTAIKVAVIGKYTKLADSYMSIFEGLKHASTHSDIKVLTELISSDEFEKDEKNVEKLANFDGILIPGGFGERGTQGMINAIKYARENDIPFLGICMGHQLMVIEYARNVIGIKDANTTEFDEMTKSPVVTLAAENKNVAGFNGMMRLGNYEFDIKPGTLLEKIYKKETATERHRNRYEVNTEYSNILQENGLVFSGYRNGHIEAAELPGKKFYLGVQYHPEFKSKPNRASEVLVGFVDAIKNEKQKK